MNDDISLDRLREIMRLTQMVERSSERKRTFRRLLILKAILFIISVISFFTSSWWLLFTCLTFDVIESTMEFMVARYVERNLASVLERTLSNDVK